MLGRVVVDGSKSTKDFAICTPTWSSTTSEACCIAAAKAWADIVKALAPYKSKAKPGSSDPWLDMVTAAFADHVDLSSSGTKYPVLDGADYKVYCAAAVVAEVDSLTGESIVKSADIYYDCGQALNPAVDIGQIEGCFVQGLGYFMTENQVFDDGPGGTGRLVNNGTWDYKIPSHLDIPVELNVTLIRSCNSEKKAVLGSKASGEPGYLLSIAVFFAIKSAAYSARAEAGASPSAYFRLDAPATRERVQLACQNQ